MPFSCLLDDLDHRVLHRLRGGARVVHVDADRRRRDGRVLAHGQADHGDAPAIMTMIAMTHAKMGRSMKNRDSMRCLLVSAWRLRCGAPACMRAALQLLRRGHGLHRATPGLTFCRPSSDHAIAGGEARGDQPLAVDGAIRRDHALGHLVVLVDDHHGGFALRVARDAALRHQQRRRARARVSWARTNMPGSSSRLRIREHRAQHHRAGARIHRHFGNLEAAALGVHAAVFERERRLRPGSCRPSPARRSRAGAAGAASRWRTA